MAIPSRLGSFEVLSLLGEGGMGQVDRARDTRLGREVALKLLPESLARDEEKLARLEREAHLLASLNHLNIATLYGLEDSEGFRYLVMELVPGETLAERLTRGRLGIEEAFSILRQIAEALEAAHEKGVIHRDLKPANVKITPEGKVKLLDFGLAKAIAEEKSPDALSRSPTLTREGTEHGVILGTASYMSPERARGQALDRRTDIWSFGCVLYEVLTGRRAFPGRRSPTSSRRSWRAVRIGKRCRKKRPSKFGIFCAIVSRGIHVGASSTSGMRGSRSRRPSRSRIFYRSGDKMMAVEAETNTTLRLSKPKILFEGRFEGATNRFGYAAYDVTPGGQRFPMIRSEEESAPTRIHVVLNWPKS